MVAASWGFFMQDKAYTCKLYLRTSKRRARTGKCPSCGEGSLEAFINSDQAVIFLTANSDRMLAFVLFRFFSENDSRSDFLNTKHLKLSGQRGRYMYW